jgi:hypothetical protein
MKNKHQPTDALQEWLINNRHEWEEAKAPDTLWEEIAQDLEKYKSLQNRRAVWKYTIRIAASVLLLAGLFVGWQMAEQYKAKPAGTLAYPAEMYEADAYYRQIINLKMEQVKNTADNYTLKQLLADLDELEQEFDALRQDLDDLADNSQIVEAMIQNYRIRIQLLERVLREFDHKKSINPVET